ncbi:uncharacterized protein C16orf96 homolog [Elgaria multicarinata webbii]|uniref:uncharacterized protein C16orf96 homolog n=1 Tax=Elgaria multicarinata webbii TaxID=159646 RepID=UPI002FCD27A2
MSHTVSFAELVNLAIGTPELGNVNFNALHLFLRSLLEHLHLQDVQKDFSDDELDFIKPPSTLPASVATSAASVPMAKKSSSIFHQMHERIAALERQLCFLNDSPDTDQLLARSQGATQPAQDMWQMMQLKKKMELNEEGVVKAMKTLQDLLDNVCTLRMATSSFQEELGQLKESFTNLNIDEMKARIMQLDEQAKMMDELRGQLGLAKEKATDPSDLVHWSGLCEMLTGKSFSETEKEGREKTSREMLAVLGQLPEKHQALLSQIAQLEAQLKLRGGLGGISETSPDLKSLLERMDRMQSQSEQGKESLQSTLEQMQKLSAQCEKLQKGVERLMKNTADIQAMRCMLEQLDLTKADKALIQEEMNVKADKSALEAKVNHGELRSATTQLSEMMQDLLQKMSLQDKDWQKALEKLFTDMDCKLDRMALDPLSRQLEEVWGFLKKYLSEGPRFDADSAAGFKKQLFERVKCISCDRPVTMMTGPHMITIRKANLRPRPASANGYEYLTRPQRKDPEAMETSAPPPPQTCWQCQAHHQACTTKRVARAQDLTTLYPYGDPMALTYDNSEVDILGVNGVLYKGRVSSQAAERAFALQREFTAVKPPRPPGGQRMERARSAFADVSASPYASSSFRRAGSAAPSSTRQQQLTVECMDGAVTSSLSQNYIQNGRGGLAGM